MSAVARAVGCLLAAVALTACGAETTGSTPSQVAASPPPMSPAATTPPAVPAPRVIAVTVAGGAVSGVDSRVPARLGEQLVVRVTSDVADEVHVHGYDLRAEVPAGGTVDIPLAATIPGGFEVELEGSGRTLFQLRVS